MTASGAIVTQEYVVQLCVKGYGGCHKNLAHHVKNVAKDINYDVKNVVKVKWSDWLP